MLHVDPPFRYPVLLVDGDECSRARFGTLLGIAGYEVSTVNGGHDALCKMDHAFCPIILIEWRIDDMDATTLCRCLREQHYEQYLYIVLIAERNTPAELLKGFNAGADDCIARDALPEKLLARMEVGRRITSLEHSLRSKSLAHWLASLTDPLTGVHNRRYLERYLPRELERCRRYHHPLSLLVCDVDNFKGVNDRYGHDVGDKVLCSFSEQVQRNIRGSVDWIARSGGDEFVVALPETTLAGAEQVAQKLRSIVAAEPVLTGGGPVTTTISIGVSATETFDEGSFVTMQQLLCAADRCLYQSKMRGRDCTTATGRADHNA